VSRVVHAIKKLIGRRGESEKPENRWIKLDGYVVCPNCRKVTRVWGHVNLDHLNYLNHPPLVYYCPDCGVGICVVDDEGAYVVVNEGDRLRMVKVR